MTLKQAICSIPLDEFLRLHNITSSEFESTSLKPQDLDLIAQDFETKKPQLLHTANFIANSLQGIPTVHSVKVRLKSRDGLVAKIIRKRIADPERVITLENYEDQITDLIGARALHLLKDEWKGISDFIRANWNAHEGPVAYYRRGDPAAVIDAFKSADLDPHEHAAGYRSIHHVVKSGATRTTHLVEIQVRTLMEEAWSEIDHNIRYPRKSDDKELDAFLMLFNSFSGIADLMGTFLINLRGRLINNAARIEDLDFKVQAAQAEIQKTISKLKISQTDRDQLKLEIEKLTTLKVVPMMTNTNSPSNVFLSTSGTQSLLDQSAISLASAINASSAGSIFASVQKRCPRGHAIPLSISLVSSNVIQKCPECGEIFS